MPLQAPMKVVGVDEHGRRGRRGRAPTTSKTRLGTFLASTKSRNFGGFLPKAATVQSTVLPTLERPCLGLKVPNHLGVARPERLVSPVLVACRARDGEPKIGRAHV